MEPKEIEKYLLNTLGIRVTPTKVKAEETAGLPLYLRRVYLFLSVKLFEQDIILLLQKNEGRFTAEQYRKHIDIIQKQVPLPAVLVLKDIPAYNRKRLIEKRIAFIIPEKQMFIPQLFIDLKEIHPVNDKKRDRFQPATQCLLLCHLLTGNIEGIEFKRIAKKLGYSANTISRSARELKTDQLCEITGTKEKHLVFHKSRRELWEDSLPYLTNPAKKRLSLAEEVNSAAVYKTSYSALPFYTDLADDSTLYLAIHKKNYKLLADRGEIKPINTGESDIYLDLWEYAPETLTGKQYVDPLSLYLTLKDVEDERVEKEIERMITALW